MKKLCVFDLDGTLANSLADIAAAMNRSLRAMARPEHCLEDYRHMVGDGMALLCKRALGHGSPQEEARLVSLYREDYQANCCIDTRPYPGIPQLLARLRQRGMVLAILTNKPQVQTDAVVQSLFPPDTFFAALGQSDRFPRKPDPEALYYLLDRAGCPKDAAWYVGDSDVDIQLGLRAGVDTVGVSWGFRGEAELSAAGALRVAGDSEALARILLENLENSGA